ncbi:zinc finger CCCH domain-containing protein 7B-like [Notolabrus celidotus]|uniref:zinc finger CCCH domain-containing protein 7B-like n=1 Tax=Notolabrus celidotus TaxID=1203425 RepID=UPI0014903D21|nr:zinc finger CCCH domain-containing protein 7B-like [Notolabrus celidotus]XP_034566450.1 zinc finger CCCH domain-containing protein 7B-like [Notolabrus celidotus]
MDPARQRRKEDIDRDLAFIQSPLAYPEPQGYQDFLTQLVCNLLEEGNSLFRDQDWEQAVKTFTEGLNVSDYAVAEDLLIPEVLLESLFVNRASAFQSMGEYERGVEDCDRALQVCKESHRALYRKALCLKELGRLREAYNCTTNPLLISRPDMKVSSLAQELAVSLGLKIRKPYVSAKEEPLITRPVLNGNVSAEAVKASTALVGNGLNPLAGLAPVRFPIMPQSSFLPKTRSGPESAASVVLDVGDSLEDSELIGDDLDSLLDGVPPEPSEIPAPAAFSCRTSSRSHSVPSVLPAPTPQLPPAFFNSPVSQLSSLDSFSGGGCSISTSTLDALDDLSAFGGAVGPAVLNMAPLSGALDPLDGLDSLDDLLDGSQSSAAEDESTGDHSRDDLDELDHPKTVSGPGPGPSVLKVMEMKERLDALDRFPSVSTLPAVSLGGAGLDSLSEFSSAGSRSAAASGMNSPNHDYKEKRARAQESICNPLSSTHQFLQACSTCFPRTGKGIYTFVHKPDLEHSCKGDLLLCRRRADPPQEWTRVRTLPNFTSFHGPFVLCRELLQSGDQGLCKYGENCNFAFNQLEIDVWSVERKGALVRTLLFESTANKLDPVSSVIHLSQEHKGVFMFLCQECFNNKPRIISTRSKANHTVCSNADVHHSFDANKCLAFVMRTHNVAYRKVRPLSLLCRLDLCRLAIRNLCQRDDDCPYAHSVIELKTWRVQRDTGISPEEIVKVSSQFHEKQEQNSRLRGKRVSSGNDGNRARGGGGGARRSLNMRMKFVCVQCWQGFNISEPDKALKHCTAKARHPWIRERSVLLVKSAERSKWVQVRPLPHEKNFPQFYDICTQIERKGKCNYTGKCTFAHSPEEREMWMYMKSNEMPLMQQIYDLWLSLTAQNLQADGAVLTQSAPEEKNIVMPTDYAEPLDGFHCRLCGRHCNSERQWQQHVSTEKHKDRVFSCDGEEEALTWSYRFPGTRFQLCPKLDAGCPDGVSCDFAHGAEELKEWTERRDFLRQKLAKAREDMLVMPDEFDFGKFNFLLQD